MRVATTRGAFEVIDEGAGGDATLVLVHGFPFDAESWRGDADLLSREMRVIAPSMRGFGGSDAPGDVFTVETMADDVAAVLDALGVSGPVVMGGLSMGGYVALAFARAHAARVRALVLADTRAEPDGDEARANREKAIARVERGELAAFVDGLFETILAPSTRASRKDIVDRVRAMATSADPKAVVAALRALRDRPDARPGLAAVSVPVLVIVGEDDALTPPAVSHAMAAMLRERVNDVRVQVISDAGHLSNLEQPDAFREAVATFVRGLGSTAR